MPDSCVALATSFLADHLTSALFLHHHVALLERDGIGYKMESAFCLVLLRNTMLPAKGQWSIVQQKAQLQGMAFGWELTMTFLLVAVVYAVAIGKPNFVETGPLAVGFALWASAFVGQLPYPVDCQCFLLVSQMLRGL